MINRAMIVVAVIATLLAFSAPAGAVLPGPNGKIVFTSGRDDGASAFTDNNAQLWVADRIGATPVRVKTSPANPAVQHRHAGWSPDGTKLVYAAGIKPDFDIYILDLTRPLSGTNPRNVSNSPGISDDHPSWSPDGTRIAYDSRRLAPPGSFAVITIQSVADPSMIGVLAQPGGTGDATKPVWSPDSKTIYYGLVVNPAVPPPNVNDDIYTKAADDSGSAIPIITGLSDDYQPALSPDGSNLCFTRGPFGDAAASVQRVPVGGGTVTTIAGSGYDCAWSPDGTKIAYVQGPFGNGNLMVKNSDGTGIATDLVPNVAGRFDGNPDWTRNPSPVCQSRTVTIGFNRTTSIPLTCVDPPPGSSPVTLSIAGPPAHGSLGAISHNMISYRPARNFSGTDRFTFKGNDGTSDSSVATVRVTIAPVISSLKVQPSRWRLGSRGAHISRKRPPVGTTISLKLSERARVRLSFARIEAGRQVKGRCVPATRFNERQRGCHRFISAGTLSFSGHAGLNRISFAGRLSRKHRLIVGSYRLTVDATDSAGAHARSQTANFTIVGG